MKALTTGACVLLGAFVIARAILVPLTYDEAAGYLRYTSQGILAVFNFEVATNHFLNTILTKLVSTVAGNSEIALRVPGLLGYGLYLYFSILILRDVRHRVIAVAGFALLHLNPYLLDYFALSRGYSLSLGLLMGALFFLLRFIARRQEGSVGTRDLSLALMFGCGSVLSSFSSLAWNAGTLTFTTTIGSGANGLQTLLPTQGPAGTLRRITCGGTSRSFSTQTMKGVQYAMFTAVGGTCQARYS